MTSPRCGLSTSCSIHPVYRVGMSAGCVARSSFPASQLGSWKLEAADKDGKDAPATLHITIQSPHVTLIFPRVGQPTERRRGVLQAFDDLLSTGGGCSVSTATTLNFQDLEQELAGRRLPQSSTSQRVTGDAARNTLHNNYAVSVTRVREGNRSYESFEAALHVFGAGSVLLVFLRDWHGKPLRGEKRDSPRGNDPPPSYPGHVTSPTGLR